MLNAGRGAFATVSVQCLLLLAGPRLVAAQEAVAGIDFLNDRLPIPESALFDEGSYIDSGVGLSFGVDKQLTYSAGQFEEAASRFEIVGGGISLQERQLGVSGAVLFSHELSGPGQSGA
jgi:hypothetical protein